MTKTRNNRRSGKRNLLGNAVHVLRAVVLEGMGILLLAGAIGYPLLTQNQWRVTSQDTQPSAIDQGMQLLLAKVGLIHSTD
ncbi:hypothetical protein GC197_17600 [bacterium]|nr:hypothetical protein [bacterium]